MSVNGISQSQMTYDLLKKSMQAADIKSQVIANNLSNLNTANFKRSYVTFNSSLQDSIDNLSLKKTNSKHISDGNEFGAISIKKDTTTSMNSDGNNVDIDSEMANQAQNTLDYEALTSQANSRISMKKYVITGGGN